jgi:hypothetical protein
MPASLVFLSILSFAILIFWFGYPLLVLVQCWQNKQIPRNHKIAWTAFIVVTWLFAGAGAIVYGLMYHRGPWKAVPAGGLLAIVIFTAFVTAQTQKGVLLPAISAYGYGGAEKAVAQTVRTPARVQVLLANINQLRAEEEKDRTLIEKNMALLAYLVALAKDDMTDPEFAEWQNILNRRSVLSPAEVKAAHINFTRAARAAGR